MQTCFFNDTETTCSMIRVLMTSYIEVVNIDSQVDLLRYHVYRKTFPFSEDKIESRPNSQIHFPSIETSDRPAPTRYQHPPSHQCHHTTRSTSSISSHALSHKICYSQSHLILNQLRISLPHVLRLRMCPPINNIPIIVSIHTSITTLTSPLDPSSNAPSNV